MTTNKLTPAQGKALAYFATKTGGRPHGNLVNKLTELGLIEHVPGGFAYDRQLTAAGREAIR